MVKKSKKLLSVLLSVLMAVSCFALPFSINAAGAYDESVANSAKAALDAYEGAMNGTVYKSGMKTAYDAYVALNKAYDEYVYGANYDIKLADATTELTTATSAMSSSGTWSAYKGTAVPNDAGGNIDSQYFNNLLYSESGTNRAAASHNQSNVTIDLYYGSTVMLYDGVSNPKMPVIFNSYNDSAWYNSKTRYIYQFYPCADNNSESSHSKLKLTLNANGYTNGNWQGRRDKSGANFTNAWQGSAAGYARGVAGDASTNERLQVDRGTWGIGSNTMEYYASLSDWKDVISNVYWFRNTGENPGDKYWINADKVTIQVFNYQKVTDAIGSATDALKNVANYKNGSLSTAMEYLDKLTVDPNSFFTSGNGIDNCVANYQTPADNMASAINNAKTDQDYQPLREAILAARAALSGDLNSYTYDSVTSYQNALAAAQNKFAPVDYTVSCSDELNALTKAELVKAADLSALAKICDIIDSSTFDISVYTDEAQAYLKTVKDKYNSFYTDGYINVAESDQVAKVDSVVNEAISYLNVSIKEDTTDNPNTNLQNQKFTLTVNSNVDGVAATNSKSYAFGKVANINDVFDLQGYLDGSHTVSCVVSTPNSTNAKDVVIDLTMFDKTFFMQQDITVTLDIKTKGEGVVIIQGYDGSVITSYTGTAVLSEDGKTLTVNGETVSPIESPTYTFTKWVKVSTADGTVVYKQVGSRISRENKITVVDGSISNTPTTLNTGYTINYTGSDTFLAWVKIVGDVTVVDSYQAKDLVRYTSTESAVTYIAITEQNIDSSTLGPNKDIKLSDDIKQTIQHKAPATYSTGYVANDKFVISGEFTNTGIDTSKYTITSVGVVISKTNTEPTKGGSACAALEIKNYSSSGTFTASINSSVSTLYGRTYVAYTENVEGVGEVTRIAYGPVCTINK